MGAALRAARSRAVADGLPAATWAGVELLGDGDFALAAPEPRAPPVLLLFALGALAFAVLVLIVKTRNRGSVAG
jgi:hypothetical protein